MRRSKLNRQRQRTRRIQFGIILLFLIGGAAFVLWALVAGDDSSRSAAPGEGASQYAVFCSGCHGPAGEGVPGAGPPVDASGSAWRLSDGELGRLILDGGASMPGFRASMGEAEARAVLAYMKGWWTETQLESQHELNRDGQ